MLCLEHVGKTFGEVAAVSGISLTIPQGQMVGIIGRSGAGKTTLLRLINRLADLSEGRIVCDNLEVSACKGRELRTWRARCAMIFQQFHLVPRLDVITNVLMGRLNYTNTLLSLFTRFTPMDRAMAIRSLERLDMASCALQRADTLSGGQQQSVAIARALVQEVHILLADEPIASLDLHNATRFGPTSYAQCWIVTKGAVEPLVGDIDEQDTFGYHSVIAVKQDSPYHTLEDLKGKKLALADPNSTSGHQAPRYFLLEEGYNIDTLFGETAFSGSHENSMIGLLNGTFDAAVTWWNSDTYSNPQRMEMKGMIPAGQWRVIWKSPKLPSSPWAMPTHLPESMRQAVADALFNMPQADAEAWTALNSGQVKSFRRVTHADYEAIVRMIQYNLKQRKASN